MFAVFYRSSLAFACLILTMALPASAHLSIGSLLALNRNVPEAVIHSFQGFQDGASPSSTLLADGKNGFYGTTQFGGGGCQGGCGTVFHVVPRSGGGYVERIVHAFSGSGDGTNPEAGLVADAAGNLYGTTEAGGNVCFPPGCGTVFKLTPQQGGFAESVIYAFSGRSDGTHPSASLVVDARGELIGTAGGGSMGDGVVFELTPSGGGYKESVLYTFGSHSGDGSDPSGPVIVDARGDLYGLTADGGAAFSGTVFRLEPTAHGYAKTILYTFSGGADGASPGGPLAFGPGGVLYGTTYSGGSNGAGVVFELVPSGKNAYAEKTIQTFTTVGAEPEAGVFVDSSGALYGTTAFGGLPGCSNGGGCGIVFRLTPKKAGFTYDILHVFGGGRDASEPLAGLIPGPSGELYGTTLRGGTGNYGTVYRIK